MGKRSRRKQRESSPPRITSNERRRLSQAVAESVEVLYRNACDPDYPADQAVEGLFVVLQNQWPGSEIFEGIAIKSSPQRVRDLADAALARYGESELALMMGAFAGNLEGDLTTEIELLEKAAALQDQDEDPAAKLALADALIQKGELVRGLGLISPILPDDPSDMSAHWLYAEALHEAQLRLSTHEPKDLCPCGSGRTYRKCCRDAEAAEVARFLDRTPLYELRESINPFLDSQVAQGIVTRAAVGWFDAGLGDPHQDEGDSRMFYDWATTAPDLSTPDDDNDTIVSLFALEPGVPEDVRRRALSIHHNCLYGLWQVRETEPSPGLMMVDLLSATRLYVACAPEQVEELPRWTVMMGPMFAMDGVWRLGGSMAHLTPLEADRLVGAVLVAADRVTKAAGRGSKKVKFRDLGRLPASAAVDEREPASPTVTHFLSSVLRSMFPKLFATVQQWRREPMAWRNTDGDPLLLIEATIDVDDVRRVVELLASREDFELDEEEDSLTWFGREMTEDELRMNLEQARVLAQQHGGTLNEDDHDPRWVRGSLGVKDGALKASLNSRNRLDLLLATLGELGCSPRVIDESRVDPSLDLPHVPSTAIGFAREMPQAQFEAWASSWLDQRVPALEDMTPLEAAKDPEGRVRLEALLRQFEYSASEGGGVSQIRDLRGLLGPELD